MIILCVKCPENILKLFVEKNDRIILILDEWDQKFLRYSADILEKVIVYKVSKIDSIEELSSVHADLITKGIALDKAVSGAEYAMFASGYFNTLLKSDTSFINLAIATRDKRIMKTVFDDSGVKSASLATTVEILSSSKSFQEKVNFPVVCKPSCGTGTFNTEVIYNQLDLDNYFDNLSLHPALVSKNIVVQEYIQGEEFHIDNIWSDGKIVFSSISKYLIPRIEINNSPHMNGSCVLPFQGHEDLYSQVEDGINKIASNLGIKNGVSHIEFFINPDGIVFSEVASRFAGAYVPEAIEIASGLNIIEEWVNIESGHDFTKQSMHPSKFAGWINLSPPRSGKVKSLPEAHQLMSVDWIKSVDIRIDIGDHIELNNPSIWCIFIAFTAESYEDYTIKNKFIHENFLIELE